MSASSGPGSQAQSAGPAAATMAATTTTAATSSSSSSTKPAAWVPKVKQQHQQSTCSSPSSSSQQGDRTSTPSSSTTAAIHDLGSDLRDSINGLSIATATSGKGKNRSKNKKMNWKPLAVPIIRKDPHDRERDIRSETRRYGAGGSGSGRPTGAPASGGAGAKKSYSNGFRNSSSSISSNNHNNNNLTNQVNQNNDSRPSGAGTAGGVFSAAGAKKPITNGVRSNSVSSGSGGGVSCGGSSNNSHSNQTTPSNPATMSQNNNNSGTSGAGAAGGEKSHRNGHRNSSTSSVSSSNLMKHSNSNNNSSPSPHSNTSRTGNNNNSNLHTPHSHSQPLPPLVQPPLPPPSQQPPSLSHTISNVMTTPTTPLSAHPFYPPTVLHPFASLPVAAGPGSQPNPTAGSPSGLVLPVSAFALPVGLPPVVVMDPQDLKDAIRTQIEYYFSQENLKRDMFIRKKMDPEGYLPISLIASFHRVQSLTPNVSVIIQSLEDSLTVELSENHLKARPRDNPLSWPITESN